MVTPNKQLLSMMSPEQGRLLDKQMRDKALDQRFSNAGMFSGIGRAYAGLMDTAQNVVSPQVGANEQQAMAMQAEKAKKEAEQAAIDKAIAGAEGTKLSERLNSIADKLEASGNPEAIKKAFEFRMKAEEAKRRESADDRADAQLKLSQDREARLSAAEQVAKNNNNSTVHSSETVFDAEGNMYTKSVLKDNTTVVKPVGNSPEQPVGRLISRTELAQDKQLEKQINIQYSKALIKEQQAVREARDASKKSFDKSYKVLTLLKKLDKDDTGGVLNTKLMAIAKALGMDDAKTVTKEMLNKALREDILSNLKTTFGGSQITDSERTYLETTMPSINDSPELIKRKAEANLALQTKIMKRLNKLAAVTPEQGYSEYQRIQQEMANETYNEVIEKYQDVMGVAPEETTQSTQTSSNDVLVVPKNADPAYLQALDAKGIRYKVVDSGSVNTRRQNRSLGR